MVGPEVVGAAVVAGVVGTVVLVVPVWGGVPGGVGGCRETGGDAGGSKLMIGGGMHMPPSVVSCSGVAGVGGIFSMSG
jgi:hypothetical protein